jgi:hypothetical protein
VPPLLVGGIVGSLRFAANSSLISICSEDRWSAQHGTPDRPLAATMPDANAPSPETTGQASAKSEKMEPEMDAVGEAKTAPGGEKK